MLAHKVNTAHVSCNFVKKIIFILSFIKLINMYATFHILPRYYLEFFQWISLKWHKLFHFNLMYENIFSFIVFHAWLILTDFIFNARSFVINILFFVVSSFVKQHLKVFVENRSCTGTYCNVVWKYFLFNQLNDILHI